jgi:hypothetical protein
VPKAGMRLKQMKGNTMPDDNDEIGAYEYLDALRDVIIAADPAKRAVAFGYDQRMDAR